jgi:hypothetical protein
MDLLVYRIFRLRYVFRKNERHHPDDNVIILLIDNIDVICQPDENMTSMFIFQPDDNISDERGQHQMISSS